MDWTVIWQYRAALWDGLLQTLQLSVVACIGSFVLGTFIGCIGASRGYLAQRLTSVYIESLRNVPVIVKLVILYYVVGLDAVTSSYIALIVHQSAYIANVVAAGLRTIPREQVESARASGLDFAQCFLYIQLPQALRVVIPPMTNQFVEVVKNSAVVMVIGVTELTYQAQQIESDTFRGFEATTVVAVLYILITFAIVNGMTVLERRLARSK
jgi:His/Glu/Gln/Arg/opine family amino acid ABC transporter permease subunit